MSRRSRPVLIVSRRLVIAYVVEMSLTSPNSTITTNTTSTAATTQPTFTWPSAIAVATPATAPAAIARNRPLA